MSDNKLKAVSTLFGFGVLFLLAWIFDILPLKEYGWFAGLFHGGWLVPNYVFSWFDADVLTKAPIHTKAYNVCWWIGCITGIWYFVVNFIGMLVMFFKKD